MSFASVPLIVAAVVLVIRNQDNFRYQQQQKHEEQTVSTQVLALCFQVPRRFASIPSLSEGFSNWVPSLYLFALVSVIDTSSLTNNPHIMSSCLLWNKCTQAVRNGFLLFCRSGYCATAQDSFPLSSFLEVCYVTTYLETYLKMVVTGHLAKGFSWPLLSPFFVGHTHRSLCRQSVIWFATILAQCYLVLWSFG